jgi:hypothetical protein
MDAGNQPGPALDASQLLRMRGARVRRAREHNAPFCDAPSGNGESPGTNIITLRWRMCRSATVALRLPQQRKPSFGSNSFLCCARKSGWTESGWSTSESRSSGSATEGSTSNRGRSSKGRFRPWMSRKSPSRTRPFFTWINSPGKAQRRTPAIWMCAICNFQRRKARPSWRAFLHGGARLPENPDKRSGLVRREVFDRREGGGLRSQPGHDARLRRTGIR